MKTYNVTEIEDDSYFSNDLYLDDKFLLLIQELPFSLNLKKTLANWSFETVLCEGENLKEKKEDLSDDFQFETFLENLESEKLSKVKQIREEILTGVEARFQEFLKNIEELHDTAKQGLTLNVRNVADLAKELVDFVRENKKQILLIQPDAFSKDFDYIIIHEMRSSVFAIIIGLYLKFPMYRLIDLAIACLVHEIGMARIPPSVYNSKAPLTIKEKQILLTHPIISYNIVNTSSFSKPICLACLEHHERENGGGYPRRLDTNRISFYGKIIAVACSYEAATAPRPYRQAKNPTTVIMELVKNENKQYDDSVLKALLYSISFFPIGTYVVLSDGRAAQVVDVNPDDPRFPIVKILGELSPSGGPKIIGTNKISVYITRTISKEEAETMIEVDSI
ncbi:MAG: HD-GYP domain-containing protein [Treponemataceae bacterium]